MNSISQGRVDARRFPSYKPAAALPSHPHALGGRDPRRGSTHVGRLPWYDHRVRVGFYAMAGIASSQALTDHVPLLLEVFSVPLPWFGKLLCTLALADKSVSR